MLHILEAVVPFLLLYSAYVASVNSFYFYSIASLLVSSILSTLYYKNVLNRGLTFLIGSLVCVFSRNLYSFPLSIFIKRALFPKNSSHHEPFLLAFLSLSLPSYSLHSMTVPFPILCSLSLSFILFCITYSSFNHSLKGFLSFLISLAPFYSKSFSHSFVQYFNSLISLKTTLLLWISLGVVMVVFVFILSFISSNSKSKVSVNRKFFHFLLVLSFLIAFKRAFFLGETLQFLLTGFYLLEIWRICFPNFSFRVKVFTLIFQLIADEKDTNIMVFSHIYLVLGTLIPLLVSINFKLPNQFFILMSCLGIASIGVGDSLAAIGGKLFGRHNISHNNSRTFEGSFTFIISTFSFFILMYLSFDFSNLSLSLCLCFLIISLFLSIIEAICFLADNIIVPFYGIILLLFCLKLSYFTS
ncbi:hypothetical protein RCL1_004700 [Eukaryota sp. TZLM3-RCL]